MNSKTRLTGVATGSFHVEPKAHPQHQVRELKDHLEKLLEAICPNHSYPVKHKLKDCTRMKNFMMSGALSKVGNPRGT
jgi:hypothetical protein